MKKLLITIVVLATAAISAHAQLNIEAGMSMGNYFLNNQYNSKPGLTVGALYDIHVGNSINEVFFIEPGVRFTMKNATLKSSKDTSFNCSWIEVPVYFGSNIEMGTNWTFAAKVGLFYAFNLSQKRKIGSETFDYLANGGDARVLNRHDAGITGSLMFYYKGIGFGTGYSYGLVNTFNKATYGDGSAHTSSWNVYLAFRF